LERFKGQKKKKKKKTKQGEEAENDKKIGEVIEDIVSILSHTALCVYQKDTNSPRRIVSAYKPILIQ
jgi:hypothetical protein